MKKIIVGFILVLAVAGAGGWYFLNGKQIVNPLGKTAPKSTIAEATSVPVELTTWKDPLGFTFDYPKNMKVNQHDEDKDNYAHVELTSPAAEGNIVVWAKDNTYSTLDEWLKGDKTVRGGSPIDTNWGGEKAKKVVITGDNPRVVIATFFDDLLYIIEKNGDKDGKLDASFNAIVASYSFSSKPEAVKNTRSDSGAPPAADDSEFAGDEEVVE